jgi:hypothetical protein
MPHQAPGLPWAEVTQASFIFSDALFLLITLILIFETEGSAEVTDSHFYQIKTQFKKKMHA